MTKLIVIIFSILFGLTSLAQTKNFIDKPYLETIAKVDTLVKPDIIYLDIIISEKDNKNKIAIETLESKMIDKLISIGINTEKQLYLVDLASNFRKYFFKQTDIIKNKAYKLKVFNATEAGRVLVELEGIGVSNVNLNKTEYSKIEELKLALKSKATAIAKKQAEALIKPLGQKINKAIYINDKFQLKPNNYNDMLLDEIVVYGYGTKRKQELKQTQIEFKAIEVESEVLIRFEIE